MSTLTARLAFLVLAAAFLGHPGAAFAAAAQSQGEISYLEGTVTIDSAPASIGDVVPFGATVRTDKDSICEIIFRQRNAIRLEEQTSFVFNPGNLQVGSVLQKGSLSLVLKNLVKGAPGDRSFYVRTATATAGVRGTSFFMKVENPTTTYVCLCNGVLRLDDSTLATGIDIEAAHHAAYRVIDRGGSPSIEKAPMLYHTDEGMQAVASTIGYTIDWTTIDR
jgi:hypothetical protein